LAGSNIFKLQRREVLDEETNTVTAFYDRLGYKNVRT
jgi:hypothetical protein